MQARSRERDMADTDYVLVGGGLNALVAAATLGKKGRTALVLDRNPAIGGCLRTEAVTAPGFVHDVMATDRKSTRLNSSHSH